MNACACGHHDGGETWRLVREKLRELGVDLSACCHEHDPAHAKLVCVSPDLTASLRQLGRTPRDQVVMVRVDGETAKKLDAWVETGAVRSRSEAAALFIREGLSVRAAELNQLGNALQEVEEARRRLQEKARQILGEEAESEGGEGGAAG